MTPRQLGGVWSAVCLSLTTLQTAAATDPILFLNEHPEIQMWSYPAGSANGPGSVRDRAPTFGAFSGFDEQTQQAVFFSGTGLDPSRRGSFIIAADTSADVPMGLAANRYHVESLRITATVLGSLVFPPDFVLPYDNTIDDSIALTTGGGDDPGNPIELYGIGLQGDYDTIEFTGTNPDALQLGSVRWRQYREGEEGFDPNLPLADQAFAPYQFYAIDAAGRDAENSVVGGYSATEPSNTTDQFTPEPFAIGKLYNEQGVEYAPGINFSNGDVFVFEPDLTDERIMAYVQQSLAQGHLGFSMSSLHQPAGHTGAVPYPDFYLDDLDVGNNPDGAAPSIELTVTIRDELLPGDFDNSGYVDTLDYDLWRSQFGSSGPAADGNLDGIVDIADYTVWRDNLGTGTPPSGVLYLGATSVPEPSAIQLASVLGLIAMCCGWFDSSIRARKPRRN